MAKQKTRRALSRERALRARIRQGLEPEPVAPEPRAPRVPKTYAAFDSSGKPERLTDDGLRLVSLLAGRGAAQAYIASKLGMILRQFKNLLETNRGDNPVRLAWESGHARFEYDITQDLLRHGRTQFVPLIFLARTKLGWEEAAKQAAAVNVQSNVQLVLPKSRTRAEYFAMLGVDDPHAPARPAELKVVEQTLPGLPAPESQPTTKE